MEERIKEALGTMKYRRFWYRDHEKDCDVICLRFSDNQDVLTTRFKEDVELAMSQDNTEMKRFVSYLQDMGINAYIHCGPTGQRFAAIDCSDKDKLSELL